MFGLFKKDIHVHFINVVNGDVIGTTNMKPEQLPASFEAATTLTIQEKAWQVVKADPVHAREFTASKKLTIYLRPIETIDPSTIVYSVATITNELPETTPQALFSDFKLELHEDDWRQVEFFPPSFLPRIQEEMHQVEAILDEGNGDPPYAHIHVRQLERQAHSIPFGDFCERAGIVDKGALMIRGLPGYVKDGFVLRSPNHIYYGTVTDGLIRELCLVGYDHATEEFQRVVQSYDLLLVVWPGGQITGF